MAPACAKDRTTVSVGRKYGNGVPLDVLAEAVAKATYKGLDLPHLYVRRVVAGLQRSA
jgi:ribosomal protein L22